MRDSNLLLGINRPRRRLTSIAFLRRIAHEYVRANNVARGINCHLTILHSYGQVLVQSANR